MPSVVNEGIGIRYEVEGVGEPLVMVDGFSTPLEMWQEEGYVAGLADACQLILIDARGHGQSDKPHDPGQYRPELMAGDAVAVLDALGIEQAHYLGASMGAAIGFEIARRAPRRLRSLVLMGYGRYGPPTEMEQQFQAFGRKLEEMAVAMGAEAALAMLEQQAGPRPPADRARFLANDHGALLAFLTAFAEWPGFEDALGKMTIPTLILTSEGDPVYPSAQKCAEQMPNATFRALPGGVHTQRSYGAESIVPIVREFLQGLH